MNKADLTAQSAIEASFGAAIPSAVARQFEGQIESPTLRAALRSATAELLVRICTDVPLPRGQFVAAVAQAAQSKV
jgi:hypothetical protein